MSAPAMTPPSSPAGAASASRLRIVVMGVTGVGKSTVGPLLAQALGLPFVEGEELHPPHNKARIAAGTPLSETERAPWLAAVAGALAAHADSGLVITCTALQRGHRDLLRAAAPDLKLVHLHGEPDLLARRLRRRRAHFSPPWLLRSQLQALQWPQPDEAVYSADVAPQPARLVSALLPRLRRAEPLPLASPTEIPMHFNKVVLFTGVDGRACFRDEALPLTEGKPQARLSPLLPSGGLQLRMSPVGFRSDFHCTENPQWLFVLGGQMEIGLQDGSTRLFKPGDHFYSADTLPPGATFDPRLHGHCSRQVGDAPLVTAFVRA